MSTIPTLIPLYWAVIPIAILLFVIFILAMIIYYNRREIQECDNDIALLTDRNANLRKQVDHARDVISKSAGAAGSVALILNSMARNDWGLTTAAPGVFVVVSIAMNKEVARGKTPESALANAALATAKKAA